eukprot:s4034_g2.t1
MIHIERDVLYPFRDPIKELERAERDEAAREQRRLAEEEAERLAREEAEKQMRDEEEARIRALDDIRAQAVEEEKRRRGESADEAAGLAQFGIFGVSSVLETQGTQPAESFLQESSHGIEVIDLAMDDSFKEVEPEAADPEPAQISSDPVVSVPDSVQLRVSDSEQSDTATEEETPPAEVVDLTRGESATSSRRASQAAAEAFLASRDVMLPVLSAGHYIRAWHRHLLGSG